MRLQTELQRRGVDFDLLPPSVTKFSSESSTEDWAIANLSLRKRVTVQTLLQTCAKAIGEAQTSYLESLKQARAILQDNFDACSLADNILGVERGDDNEEESDYRQLKDGSVKLDCPMSGCKSNTFKLKRHLLDQHSLNEEQITFALKFARKASKNKLPKASTPSLQPTAPKRIVYQNTALVNRKNNFKKCSLCSKLYLNIAQHIRFVHKIDRNDCKYLEWIKSSQVIPKVYTKREEGRTVELTGEELEKAKIEYGKCIAEESETLGELKRMRLEIEDMKISLSKAKTKERYDEIKKKLTEVEALYKESRYKDKRNYSANLLKWKNSFKEFLDMRDCNNPERGARMALDVLLPYEEEEGPLQFSQLMDGRTMRSLLASFKKVKSLTSTSKTKYLKQFELMMQFLLCDCYSPERKEDDPPEELLRRKLKMEDIKHELESMHSSLRKRMGEDQVETKKKAKKRLIGEENLNEIATAARKTLSTFINETKEEMVAHSVKEVIEIRNSLMVVAAIRLARRSMELMKMTIEQAKAAEESVVDGEKYKIITVLQQKGLKAAKEAAIAYTEDEYKALCFYIEHLRPKLAASQFNRSVFIPKSGLGPGASEELTFSSTYKILQKFTTESGQKLSSRAIRGSKITNNRTRGTTDQERRDLARAMTHSVETAERYYNFEELSSSVSRSLSRLSQSNQSAVEKDLTNASMDTSETSLSVLEPPTPEDTSTPRKTTTIEKNLSQVNSPGLTPTKRKLSDELDETFKVLRQKKVKTKNFASEKRRQVDLVKEAIESIVSRVPREKFFSKSGTVLIQPVTSALSKGVTKLFSVKEIRSLVSAALEERGRMN